MHTNDFFKNLAPLRSFAAAADHSNHQPIPDDWLVIVSDVLGSTKAIEQGKYKEVNTIGVSTIMAIINVDRQIEIPYIFGGDGATLAIPPCMELGARRALLGSQKLARERFDLDLRIGIVPVRDLLDLDMRVFAAKLSVSEHITQASLSGRGWEYAESLIKGEKTRSLYEVVQSREIQPDADFTGFECRWQGVPSRKDHKICMLLQSVCPTAEEQLQVYSELFEKLYEVYGDLRDHHPVNEESLALTLNPLKLLAEARIRTKSAWAVPFYVVKCFFICMLGKIVFSQKIDTKDIKGSTYVSDVVKNTDFRKYDGSLKMVLDGSIEQEEQISQYLESLFQQGKLVYGLHTAPQALMTCLIFSYDQKHAHFVDGSDGGYAMAAKDFKQRLAAWKESRIAA